MKRSLCVCVCVTLSWPTVPPAPWKNSSMRRVVFQQIQAMCGSGKQVALMSTRVAGLRNFLCPHGCATCRTWGRDTTPKFQAGHKSLMGLAPLIWPVIKCVKLYYCALCTPFSHCSEHGGCLSVMKAAGAEMWLTAVRICNVFAFTHTMCLCNCYVQTYTFLRTG